ncbi:MAG: hypothetical protein Q9179_005532, partial [Wetmoreana sp. 5 TL-2023]
DQEMEELDGTLQVGKDHTAREKSPLRLEQLAAGGNERPRIPEIEVEDMNMKEDGEVSAGPDKTFAPFEGLVGNDMDEGEEEDTAEEPPKVDSMDES